MRTFEIGIVALALMGAFLLRRGTTDAVRWGFLALAAGVVGSHVAREGVHWQMAPAYVALGLVIWFGLGAGVGRAVQVGVMVLCLGSLALSWVLPMFRLPAPTGANAVGTRTLHMLDGGRGRELVVQLWYPAVAGGVRARYVPAAEVSLKLRYEAQIRTNAWQDAAVTAGSHPVVLLEHMWTGRRTGYTFLAEELASHGFVVVAMDHPGNSARTQLADGRVVVGAGPGLLADVDAHTAEAVETMWVKELEVWTADNEFVLGQLAGLNAVAGGWASGRLDLSRIGAVGHSFGGAASERLLGLQPAPGKPRVRCAANLDGWSFGGLERRTTEPLMVVYEGVSRTRTVAQGTEGRLDADDNAAVDASLARSGGYRFYVDGTQHLDFSDQTLVSPVQRLTYTGPLSGARSRQITRGLVLGFFEQCVEGRGDGPARFAEVQADPVR